MIILLKLAYTPLYKANPDEGVECKPRCPIPNSGDVQITSDCYLYSQIVVTGKLNVTGVPDANGVLPKIIGGGSTRLFKVESGGELVVKYLNLTGGDVSGNDGTSGNSLGGSIYKNGNGVVRIIHTVITGNKAAWGGAIYSWGDSSIVEIKNSNISRNIATSGHGGGVFVKGGKSYIHDSFLSFNKAMGKSGGGGYFEGNAVCEFERSLI
eukprot:g12228.t1